MKDNEKFIILNNFPVIREFISYSSVAADATKDILILTETWLVILKTHQTYILPNLSFDDNQNIISLDKIKNLPKGDVKIKLISSIDNILKIEVSKLKKHGSWLMGNKLYGYEIRICAKACKVGLLCEEAVSDNLLSQIERLFVNKVARNVRKFSYKVKKRNFFFKFSGIIVYFSVKSTVFIINVFLLTFGTDHFLANFTGHSDTIEERLFIKVILLWSYYRLAMNFFYRNFYKESKKKTVKPFISDKPIIRFSKSKILGVIFKTIGTSIILFLLTYHGTHFGHRLNIYIGIGNYSISQIVLEFIGYSSLALIYIGYLHTKKTHVRDEDSVSNVRKKILYLRSFQDDESYSFNIGSPITLALMGIDVPIFMKSVYTKWLANFHPLRMFRVVINSVRDNAEEQLIYSFVKNGYNVIALGRPQEVISPGGADRVYLSHKEWQAEVGRLIDDADIVLVQPGTTEGVSWEITQTILKKNISDILFVFPNKRQGYVVFENLLSLFYKNHIITTFPIKYTGDFFFYFTDNYQSFWLESFHWPAYLWPVKGHTINFEKTLKPFFQKIKPIQSQKNKITPPSISFLLSIINTVIILGIVFNVTLNVDDLYKNDDALFNKKTSNFLYNTYVDSEYMFYNEILQKNQKQKPLKFIVGQQQWTLNDKYLLGSKYKSLKNGYVLEFSLQPSYGDFYDRRLKAYNVFQKYTGDLLSYMHKKNEVTKLTYIEHVNNKSIVSLKKLNWMWHLFYIINISAPDNKGKYDLEGVAMLKQIDNNQIILVEITKQYKGLINNSELKSLLKEGFVCNDEKISVDIPVNFFDDTKFKLNNN